MLTKLGKPIAGMTLGTIICGCCLAAAPGKPSASIVEAYREIGLAWKCSHLPHKCISRDYHTQRLLIDELCFDSPKCEQIEVCLKKHIDFIYVLGCNHAAPCGNALVHYNTMRREQGLEPIALP